MKTSFTKIITVALALFFLGSYNATASTTTEDVQLFSAPNKDQKITPKSIAKAFGDTGLSIVGNNNMNTPFSKRFPKLYYKVYNLAMFVNNDLSFKLLKKYPSFGALTPLTMSIWQDKDGNMNIATLTARGMARVTQIPVNDPDLNAYAALVQKALKNAMPKGKFQKTSLNTTDLKKPLQVNFVADIDMDDEDFDLDDYIDDFESEFEGEMEALGFLFPNITNVQEEIFDEHDYKAYDFYHTYSMCKFDVIYPVSKLHPAAGAWAPCSFYIYKKKGEKKLHMGFLSVENWIESLNIKDQESIKPLKEAEGMIKNILKEITE